MSQLFWSLVVRTACEHMSEVRGGGWTNGCQYLVASILLSFQQVTVCEQNMLVHCSMVKTD